jgi:hypothetical protein
MDVTVENAIVKILRRFPEDGGTYSLFISGDEPILMQDDRTFYDYHKQLEDSKFSVELRKKTDSSGAPPSSPPAAAAAAEGKQRPNFLKFLQRKPEYPTEAMSLSSEGLPGVAQPGVSEGSGGSFLGSKDQTNANEMLKIALKSEVDERRKIQTRLENSEATLDTLQSKYNLEMENRQALGEFELKLN